MTITGKEIHRSVELLAKMTVENMEIILRSKKLIGIGEKIVAKKNISKLKSDKMLAIADLESVGSSSNHAQISH